MSRKKNNLELVSSSGIEVHNTTSTSTATFEAEENLKDLKSQAYDVLVQLETLKGLLKENIDSLNKTNASILEKNNELSCIKERDLTEEEVVSLMKLKATAYDTISAVEFLRSKIEEQVESLNSINEKMGPLVNPPVNEHKD